MIQDINAFETLCRISIDNGIAALDDNAPNWREHIDKDQLDMSSCRHCVLGQLYGDFADGLRDLGVCTMKSSSGFGFCSWDTGQLTPEQIQGVWDKIDEDNESYPDERFLEVQYEILQEQWLKELSETSYVEKNLMC